MDLLSEFRRRGIDTAVPGDPHYRQGWINVPCPWCHGTKKHLGITESGSRASCYKCGSKHPGRVLNRLLGWTTEQIVLFGKERLFDSETWKQDEMQWGEYLPPKGLQPLTMKDRTYLVSRGWSMDKIDYCVETYGLQSTGPFSGLPAGIFIPIKNEKGIPISWTVRFREADGPRYHTAKSSEKVMPEKHFLFGEHLLRQHGINSIIVCEGPFDAMSVGIGAVATFGLAYTVQQISRILQYPRRIVCFDSESRATVVARQLCNDLAAFSGHTELVTLDAKDPGQASTEELAELRRHAGLCV